MVTVVSPIWTQRHINIYPDDFLTTDTTRLHNELNLYLKIHYYLATLRGEHQNNMFINITFEKVRRIARGYRLNYQQSTQHTN